MRVRFDPEHIVPDLPGVIALSHGPLAEAVLDSAAMLYSERLENTAALCLEEGDSLDAYRDKLREIIDAFPEDSIIFVDFFGGTPCNQLLLLSQSDPKYSSLVAEAGMNLFMVLDAVLCRPDAGGAELQDEILEGVPLSIRNLTEIIREMSLENDGEEDED